MTIEQWQKIGDRILGVTGFMRTNLNIKVYYEAMGIFYLITSSCINATSIAALKSALNKEFNQEFTVALTAMTYIDNIMIINFEFTPIVTQGACLPNLISIDTDNLPSIRKVFAKNFNLFFMNLLCRMRDLQIIHLPDHEFGSLQFVYLPPLDMSSGFEITAEEITELSGYKELALFCEAGGCRLEILLNKVPIPNEDLVHQQLTLKISKK